MIDWITNLFRSTRNDTKSRRADQELLLNLRYELKECEALYRDGAQLCRRTCPGRIDGDPNKFPALMRDLHRGLLVKIFVEIASADRCWQTEECDMALELFHHIWGADVSRERLIGVLRKVSEHSKTLQWESLLSPFRDMPPLADQVAELNTCVMRIANLIAKADGNVLPREAMVLRSIQVALEDALGPRGARAKQARANVSRVGGQVAELVQAQPGGGRGTDGQSAAVVDDKPVPRDRKPPEEMLAEAMDELDRLIGLELIKKDIGELVNFLKVQEERQRHGLPRTAISPQTSEAKSRFLR